MYIQMVFPVFLFLLTFSIMFYTLTCWSVLDYILKHWQAFVEYLLHAASISRLGRQGCALRKIQLSPVLWNCKIWGAQHMICMKNLRFSSRPRSKVRRQGPPGSARAQPWALHDDDGNISATCTRWFCGSFCKNTFTKIETETKIQESTY